MKHEANDFVVFEFFSLVCNSNICAACSIEVFRRASISALSGHITSSRIRSNSANFVILYPAVEEKAVVSFLNPWFRSSRGLYVNF